MNKLRDKFPCRPCDDQDSLYLTDSGVDLLKHLFTLNPKERWSAEQALSHPWFKEEPAMAAQMPEFPEMNKVSRD
jgi:cell division cycle 2-like